MSSTATSLSCGVCKRSTDVQLMRCSRCKERAYCGRDCQVADWPSHKLNCGKKWYDKYRPCQDKSKHEGELELITWECPKEGTGWAAVCLEEADDMKRQFETEFKGDLSKFYKYWPQGFRWTCCGMSGDMPWGCDHHGQGSRPCTCDFCKMGEPLPDRIYHKQTASRMGLNLPRGPDRRSYNAALAPLTAVGRAITGLDVN